MVRLSLNAMVNAKEIESLCRMKSIKDPGAELMQAIIKSRRHNATWSHAVLEEIADVTICLEQVNNRLKVLPTDIDRETNRPTGYLIDIVEEIKATKLARLEERLCAAKGEVQGKE